MKKLFTLIAVLGILSVAAVKAQDFPGDPGELKVDLLLYAADVESQEDTIQGYTPTGGGVYNAGDTAEIAALPIPGYTFFTWSDQNESQTRRIAVNESMTLAALYQRDKYVIASVDDNGTAVTSGEYYYGDEVSEPDAPYRENTAQYTFTFQGWSPEITQVTGPQTYTAVWDTIVNKYEIKFLNWNDDVLQSDSLEYGAMPQYTGNEPTRETLEGVVYTFSGWAPEPVAVTEDAQYIAQFTSQDLEFTVHFLQYERDSVITAHYGDQLELLATAAESDHFLQWSDGETDNPRLVLIVSDSTFQALFEVNSYVISFFDWDETLLQRDTLEHGTMPQFRGEDPTRPEVEGQRFTFVGWAPELAAATADARYTAQYTQEAILYQVMIILDNDTSHQEANYGTEISLYAQDNDDRHFLRWQDGEQSAERTAVIVSDTVFTAIYGDSHVDIEIAADQWNFFCLPEKTAGGEWQLTDFTYNELTDVSWGTYNSAVRAASRSGWERVVPSEAKKGFIIYSSIAGRLRLNVYAENINQTDVTTTLSAYESVHSENANWNFVGNPINAEIGAENIAVTGTDEPTATIWNGTGYDNVRITSGDFRLQPLQAFFIQTTGAGQLTFNSGNNPAPARAPQVAENSRIDIQATAGGYTDKSRVIFRANSSVKYEAGRDASKFITSTAPIQMYFLDVDNIQCAQMVRPAGDDNMRLGFMMLNAGDIDINMPVFADEYELYDALTDRAYYLDETITIYSEKGTFNDRLMLRPIRKVATGIDNTSAQTVTTKVLINDQLYLLRDGKMYTVQGQVVR